MPGIVAIENTCTGEAETGERVTECMSGSVDIYITELHNTTMNTGLPAVVFANG